MKTLINIRKAEKNLRALFLIVIMVSSLALKASEVPTYTEEVYEMEQVVEDWMLVLSTWAINTGTYVSKEVVECEMEIQDWMMNPKDDIWNKDIEEELEIEKWMCDLSHCTWNDCVVEEEYEIEAWMTSPSNWLNSDTVLYVEAY